MNYTDLFGQMKDEEMEESPPENENSDEEFIEVSVISHVSPVDLSYSYSEMEMDYQNGIIPFPIHEQSNFVCMTEIKASEASQQQLETIITGTARVVSTVKEALEETKQEEAAPQKARTYTNQVKYETYRYAKPKEIDGNPVQKLVMFLIVAVIVGIFLGLQSSSYFNFKGGKVQEAFSCVYLWLMESSMPFKPFPLNGKVFTTGFLTGSLAMGLFGLFQYLDNDAKKQSRVGHEHGNARLGTSSDFKKHQMQFMDSGDYNMLFGVFKGKELGLSLDNKKVNRSANVLVIGGTGTGKTFKYIKPNLLQENCSMVVTDPSGDIFSSFAPYLLSKGYNVFLFNASDFSMSNHYNPLLNVYDSNGNISERHVNILVDLYMKNAKQGKEAGGSDPFWDKSEKAFLTALIYYVLENDNIPRHDKCFATILEKVQMAKVSDDDDEQSPLTLEMNEWFAEVGIIENVKRDSGRNKKTFLYKKFNKETNQIEVVERDAIIDFTNAVGTPYKTKMYYDTFLIAPQKTANTILITTAVDLQIFSTKEVDFITREDEEHEEMNINIDKMATQQSYLFLGIPQSHQAYNFLIAMLYSQLYGRLYELGEQKLRNKWHIGYQVGIPVFDYFDTEEQAKEFYETITENDIIPADYVNNTQIYRIIWNDHVYKSSVLKEPLEKFIRDLDKMYIWNGDDYGGAPALPIHINFLLDEFKNIGEIPNFLTILSTSRKYRIGSHVVIQDIGQLKTMYKDGEHETVMANVDTTIFLGSILKEDKEEIQKMLGKTTIRQKSTSSSNSGLSTSYTPTEVDLMSIDEIGAINQGGRDDELVIIRDTTPYLCRKLNLTEHKRWEDVKAVKQLKIDASQYYRNTKDDEKMLN